MASETAWTPSLRSTRSAETDHPGVAGTLTPPNIAIYAVSRKLTDVQLVLVGGVPIYGTEKLVSQFQVPAESVDVCKSKMVLNSAALPAGKFADVRDRLKTDLSKYKLELGPLEECPH